MSGREGCPFAALEMELTLEKFQNYTMLYES